jgi:hypothetical protein
MYLPDSELNELADGHLGMDAKMFGETNGTNHVSSRRYKGEAQNYNDDEHS